MGQRDGSGNVGTLRDIAGGLPAERWLLRVSEACAITGVPRSTGYALIAAGEWPVVRIGTALRVRADELRAWVERNTVGGQVA